MKVYSRFALDGWLRAAGVNRSNMNWSAGSVQRSLIRESHPPEFDSGPHRRIPLPGDSNDLRLPLGDRPILTGIALALIAGVSRESVMAAVPHASYWLNTRSYAGYLRNVGAAVRVHRALRTVGLTDRFQGGLLIQPYELAKWIPMLAAQPFAGGPDVYFILPEAGMILTACHEFDIHLESRAKLPPAIQRILDNSGELVVVSGNT